MGFMGFRGLGFLYDSWRMAAGVCAFQRWALGPNPPPNPKLVLGESASRLSRTYLGLGEP